MPTQQDGLLATDMPGRPKFCV